MIKTKTKREVGPFVIEYKDEPRSQWRSLERIPFFLTRGEAQTIADKLQSRQNGYVLHGCELRVREMEYQIKAFM